MRVGPLALNQQPSRQNVLSRNAPDCAALHPGYTTHRRIDPPYRLRPEKVPSTPRTIARPSAVPAERAADLIIPSVAD